MKTYESAYVMGLAAAALLILGGPAPEASAWDKGQTLNDCDTSVGRRDGVSGRNSIDLEWSSSTGSDGNPSVNIEFQSTQDLYIEQSAIDDPRELTADRVYRLRLTGFSADAADDVFAKMTEKVEVGEEPDDVPINKRIVDWFGEPQTATNVRITLERVTSTSALMSINFRGRNITFRLSNRGEGNLDDTDFSVRPSSSGGYMRFEYEVTGDWDDEIEIDVSANVDFIIGQPNLSPTRISVPSDAEGYLLRLTGFSDGSAVSGSMVGMAESSPLSIFNDTELAAVGEHVDDGNDPRVRVVMHRSDKAGTGLLVIKYRGRVVALELTFP